MDPLTLLISFGERPLGQDAFLVLGGLGEVGFILNCFMLRGIEKDTF